MSDQQIVCMVCRESFVYTEREQEFLAALYRERKIQEICPPKRCTACRLKKKQGVKVPAQVTPFPGQSGAPPSFSAPEQLPVPMREALRDVEYLDSSPPKPSPTASTTKYDPAPLVDLDIHCVLVAGDFEKLVCREEVVLRIGNRKITFVLANIGLPAMKAAMEKAVLAWWKA